MSDETEELLALTCKKNISLKCELQEAQATKEAYVIKLKEKTRVAKEYERGNKEMRGKVAELEAELGKAESMNSKLEDKIQEFLREKEFNAVEEVAEAQDIIEEMKRQEERYKVRLQQLEAKDEEIRQLKEIITNMQARSPSRELPTDERVTMLEGENARLVALVMEMKKTEAENMNQQTEHEKKMKTLNLPTATSPPPPLPLFTPRGHKPSPSLEDRFKKFVKKKKAGE